MRLKTLLAFTLGLCGLTRFDNVQADPAQSPLRVRFNKNVLTKIINMRDQDLFNAFKDMDTTVEGDETALEHTEKIKFTLLPVDSVDFDDFNFDVSYEKEYFGAESDKVQVKGVATLKDGSDVEFSAPVPLVKLRYEQGTKLNQEYNIDALNFEEKEWIFKVGDLAGEGLTDEAKTEIATKIEAKVTDFKKKFEKGGGKDMDLIKEFPMDSVIPMTAIFYAVSFSEIYEVKDQFITLGFNLMHFKMLTDKQNSMLKEIKQEFYNDQNKEGQDALFQLALDDNMFNSFATVFTSVDKSFSLRDMMKNNPKLKPFIGQMKTDAVATLIPTFTDEYGEGKKIDLMFSPSHLLFSEGIPGSKMSGMYIDKNGNWKIQANCVMNLNVERTPGNWESVREIFITGIFKFKISVNSTQLFVKKFSFTPKNLEIQNLKILAEGKENEMEQMMIQSMVNIQLENLKREFKEFPYFMNDLLSRNPKELQCLGFNIADIDVTFKKSQVQFSTYYKETKYYNKTLCEQFLAELRKMPEEVYDKVMKNAPGGKQNPFMKAIEEAQKGAAGDKSANFWDAFDDMKDEFKGMDNAFKNIGEEKPAPAADDGPEHEDL